MHKSLFLLPLVLIACTEAAAPTAKPVGLANPASVFCVEEGGTVILSDAASGGDAMCKLRDGRKVGEWEYFNEHHKAAPAPDAA